MKQSSLINNGQNSFNKVQNAKQSVITQLNNGSKPKTLSKSFKQSMICETLLVSAPNHLFSICLMMASPSWLVTVLFCNVLYENTYYFTMFWSKDTTVQ